MPLFWLSFLLSLLLPGCRKKDSDSEEKAAPIIKALHYYNHYPFNFVYTASVTLGGQEIEAVVDTGSSNLLVIGDEAHCPGCINKYGYTSTYTPSSKSRALSSSWTMNFAPIGAATVEGYQDDVQISGLALPAFSFGLVVAEEGIPNIWGLAYAQLARPALAPQPPLFDVLTQAGNLENQFSMRLCGRKTGSRMVLGGWDADVLAHLDQVKWTPVQQKRWYSVGVTRMSMQVTGDTTPSWSWEPRAFETLIVDSGTNPLVLPSDEVAAVVMVLKEVAAASSISIPDAFWPTTGPGGAATLTDAQVAQFPPLLLTLENQQDINAPITLSISSSIYFQTQADGQRFLGIQPGSSSLFILGTVLMENYVVLHDRGSLSITNSDPDLTARLGFYPIGELCR
jgi:hypothetical protein